MRWLKSRASSLPRPGAAKSVGSFTAVSVVAASLVFAAVQSEGYRTTSTDLHDGTVWTLNVERNALARVNARINEFDTLVNADVAEADIFQDGTNVYVQNAEGFAQLNAIGTNVQDVEFAELDAGSQIGVRGDTAAVLGPDGRLWVVPAKALSSVDPAAEEPLAQLGAGSQLAVTPDGRAVILDPVDDSVTVVTNETDTAEDVEGQFVVDDPVPFGHDVPAPGESSSDFDLTAVGPIAVATFEGEVLIQGLDAPVDLGGGDIVLQQPGADADQVVIGAEEALFEVALDDGETTESDAGGQGRQARPVVVDGCTYAGWEASGTVWRRCGRAEAVELDAGTDPGTNWVFRTNRDQVVLEARGANPRHITEDGLVSIDNWQDFDSDEEEENDDQTEEQPDQKEQAVCKDTAAPPEAADDSFGASPAVSVILRVLDNDRDPNCDPIAIRALGEGVWDESWGTIALIEQNQAFQYTPPAQPISFSFPYMIDDGNGNEASATVSVDVSSGSNEPPTMKEGRVSETIVEMFKSVSYNVLLDWQDPNGDTLLLESALVAEGDGSIIWSKDGTIAYTASDTVAGPKEIQISVGDGFGNVVPGTLSVSVQGQDVPIPPTARDDYVQAPAGREVTIEPLANDTDPNDDLLTLGEYERPETLRISQGEQGALRLAADEPGTYLVGYQATDGVMSDDATIRFEVTDPEREQSPPVPVRDSVVLKVGRSLSVDVLANDYDADGDVLLVTDARLQQVGLAGVDVKVIDRQYIRVQVDQDPGQPLVVEYLLTDGRSSEQVGQLVINVAPATGNQRPVAGNDSVRVRVNDVVDIPVLANDADPDGDKINILSAELDPPTQPGVLWLDGRTVRYRAGDTTGTVKAKYTIDDTPDRSGLNASSGFIEIVVVDSPPDKNLPPTPPPLEARVFAGSTVSIPIPLVGMDPDGDSVRLVRIGSAPEPINLPAQLGVPTMRSRSIAYEANVGASGQDTFTYEVEDAFGGRSVGIVRVAVFVAPNHPPALVPDTILARPGRLLQVPVLSNDSDPDGDPLILESVDPPEGLDATVNDSRVQVSPPVGEGTWQFYYDASDGKGPPVTQVLTVVYDAEAPLLPAIARDDPADGAAEPELVEDPAGGYTTTIDVLENDDDPDGARSELVVDVPLAQGVDATVEPGTGLVTVGLTDRPQSFAYSVTDFDDNVSHAIVRVPQAPNAEDANREPIIREDAVVVTIVEGETGELRLEDYVVDPDGDDVRLAGSIPVSRQGEAAVSEGNFYSFDFTPVVDLGQPEAVVFVEVTDRPDEPAATVELPFRVIVEQPNQPPTVQTTTIPVEQLGDGDPVDLVASGLAVDPEGDALEFTLIDDGGTAGLDVSLSSDGQFSASDDGAAEGTSAVYHYTVTDGEPDREPVEGQVTVSVVASTKPLVALNQISRNDIRQGEAEEVDVLAGVANPFPDKPLRVIEAQVVEGSGAVTFTDSTVTFTPPDDFFGPAEVRYTVEDGTENASRHVTGSVRFAVIGRPLAPGQPRKIEVYSHTAVLTWTPADAQGSPVTDYTVRWPGGEISSGGATTVTVDTLTNAETYTFTVSATNAVGESDESDPSGEVTPDEVPPAPNAPRITDFGDGTLSVEWDEVVPDGSPVILYHLSVSGGTAQTFPGSQLSTVWDGLTNGTDYTFSLIAENNEGRGDPSGLSGPLSPAREPDAPADVAAADTGNRLQAKATVTWSEPYNQGREVERYLVTATATGQVYDTGTKRESIDIPLPAGTTTTFTVVAVNVVGPSAASGPSAPFVAVVAPSTPAAPGVSATGNDNQITINAAGVDSGGAAISTYNYRVGTNGGTIALGPGAGSYTKTGNGLSNGDAATIQVQACNSGARGYCSDWSAPSAAVTPYGPLRESAIVLTKSGPSAGSKSFTISWDLRPAKNGRDLTSYSLTSSPNIGSSTSSNGNGKSFTGNWSTPYTVTVTVTDSAGQTASKSTTVTIGAEPPATVRVGSDSTCPEPMDGGSSNWASGACNGRGQGFIAANTTLQVTCSLSKNPQPWVYPTWYRISGGGPIGWYVAGGTTSSPSRPIPSC